MVSKGLRNLSGIALAFALFFAVFGFVLLSTKTSEAGSFTYAGITVNYDLVTYNERIGNVYYTSECLKECHLPINISVSQQVTIPNSANFTSIFKNKLGGISDKIESWEFRLLQHKNQSLNLTIYFQSCQTNYTLSDNNCTLVANGTYLQNREWDEWNIFSPAGKTLQANKAYVIDLIGYRNMSKYDFQNSASNSVDAIPRVFGRELPFAWWDNNWNKRMLINLTMLGTTDLENWTTNVTISPTDMSCQADCDDLRFIDADNTTQLNYGFENVTSSNFGCSASRTQVWVNVSRIKSDNTSQIWAYCDNDAANSVSDLKLADGTAVYSHIPFGEVAGDNAYDTAMIRKFAWGNKVAGADFTNISVFGSAINCSITSNSRVYETTTDVAWQIGSNESNYTVSVWFNHAIGANSGNIAQILMMRTPVYSVTPMRMEREVNANKTECSIAGTTLTANSTLVDDGTWKYIACERNRDSITMYLGNSSGFFVEKTITGVTANGEMSTPSNLIFCMGNNDSETQVYSGLIDDFRVINRKLTYDEHYNIFKEGVTSQQNAIETGNAAPSTQNFTLNQTWLNYTGRINIKANISDTDNNLDKVTIDIYRPDNTRNVTNSTMLNIGGTGYEYNFTAGSNEGNWTIRIWANDTLNATTMNSSWFVVDLTAPRPNLTKLFSGDAFLLPYNLFNFTANATDSYLRNFTINLKRPAGTTNQTLTYSANATFQFNFTEAYVVGNYSIDLVARDESNNTNTTTIYLAVGRINVTESSRLTILNHTSRDNALQIGNNTKLNTWQRIAITLTADGFLNARNKIVQSNLSQFGNYTFVNVTNSTSHQYTHAFSGSNATWTTQALSTGQSFENLVTTEVNESINYSYRKLTNYRYLFRSKPSLSYSAWLRINLPQSEWFDSNQFHPRYWICTSGITESFGCDTFSTNIDVTNVNNGNNQIAGYTTNMYVNESGTAKSLAIMTNQSDFLIEIVMVSGAFNPASQQEAGNGGGGGGDTIIVQPSNITGEFKCPPNYDLFNQSGTLVCKPKSTIVPAEDFFKFFMTEQALVLPLFSISTTILPLQVFFIIIAGILFMYFLFIWR